MFDDFVASIEQSYANYGGYLWRELSHFTYPNYFYGLLFISLVIWAFEGLFPWRKSQNIIRKDFWLDGFYMFFNFFLFSLIGYNALSDVGVHFFNKTLSLFHINNIIALELSSFPIWSRLLLLFLYSDFIQWNIHRLLHYNKFLWKYHKIHHSVKEMGFAAHLRFHPLETIVYKSILFVALSVIGFGLSDLFLYHMLTVVIGHLNHANINLNYGPLKYIFNNPKMHIWHHSKWLPKEYKYGVNFGISLSIWDYLFKTNHIPSDGKEIELGFEGDENYPEKFIPQILRPLTEKD